jgi:hypothetical protein
LLKNRYRPYYNYPNEIGNDRAKNLKGKKSNIFLWKKNLNIRTFQKDEAHQYNYFGEVELTTPDVFVKTDPKIGMYNFSLVRAKKIFAGKKNLYEYFFANLWIDVELVDMENEVEYKVKNLTDQIELEVNGEYKFLDFLDVKETGFFQFGVQGANIGEIEVKGNMENYGKIELEGVVGMSELGELGFVYLVYDWKAGKSVFYWGGEIFEKLEKIAEFDFKCEDLTAELSEEDKTVGMITAICHTEIGNLLALIIAKNGQKSKNLKSPKMA